MISIQMPLTQKSVIHYPGTPCLDRINLTFNRENGTLTLQRQPGPVTQTDAREIKFSFPLNLNLIPLYNALYITTGWLENHMATEDATQQISSAQSYLKYLENLSTQSGLYLIPIHPSKVFLKPGDAPARHGFPTIELTRLPQSITEVHQLLQAITGNVMEDMFSPDEHTGSKFYVSRTDAAAHLTSLIEANHA